MVIFRCMAVSALGLAVSCAHGQAFKCTAKGGVVFQQIPCEGGTQLQVAKPPDPDGRDALVNKAIASRKVAVGMTRDEVVRSWGRPDKINASVGSYGRHEQWIYRRANIADSQYVYLEDGVVRSIQSPE